MRPHLLLITCHDLGRHIGCYGVPTVHTPNLDRLASQGTRFANSFCTSPGCSPSRAAIATGRYPHCNGVMGLAHAHFGWDLSPAERHVARLLSECGYRTVLFGLQHVTYDVGRLGFEEVRLDRPADAVAANVEAFLAGWTAGSDRRPLYLEVNFFEPHRPFDFGGVGPDTERGIHVPGYLPDGDAARSELGLMQGAVRKMDAAVGSILHSLQSRGLLDDTLVMFTADHGIAFPRAKGTLYDPGIEVCLLVRWPNGGVRAGVAEEGLVSNIDLAPTLLDAAGAPIPASIQGRSLVPRLRGMSGLERDAVFAEKTFHNEYDPLRCVRTTRYKLIARFEASNPVEVPADIMRGRTYGAMMDQVLGPRGQPFELYDLSQDRWERDNRVDEPEYRSTASELRRRLRAWMEETEDPLLLGPVPSPYYHRTLAQLRT